MGSLYRIELNKIMLLCALRMGSLVEHKYDATSLENGFRVNCRNRGIYICQVEDLSLF